MEEKNVHCLTVSIHSLDSLISFCELYRDIILASGFSEDSYFHHSYFLLVSFFRTLRKNVSDDPDAFYDLFLALNNDSYEA